MCDDCWKRYGSPTLDTPAVRRMAELVAEIYVYGAVGQPYHVQLDDWNLDGNEWEQYWGDDEPPVGDPWRDAADELGELIKTMSVEERASALALVDGWWSLPPEVGVGR